MIDVGGIDAVVPWPDGFVYFVKGPQYVRWDATDNTVDTSLYPTRSPISGPRRRPPSPRASTRPSTGATARRTDGLSVPQRRHGEQPGPAGLPAAGDRAREWPELVAAGFNGGFDEVLE
jgi:hypothetical protein